MTDVDVETKSICLPVTALHLLRCESQTLLLIAQGPFISICDANTKQKYAACRVSEIQAIHGIASSFLGTDVHGRFIAIVVFAGGSYVSRRELEFYSDGSHPKLAEPLRHGVDSGRSYIEDWILRVYHHQTKSRHGFFVMLTANNKLLSMQPETGSLSQLMQGPEVFLYAGDVISDGSDRLIVASGSAFGEVLLWSCSRDDNKSWTIDSIRRFQGHKGSIFGVSISNEFTFLGKLRRLVASCSDDRRMNVWDVSDFRDHAALTPAMTSQTGFGGESVQSRSLVATGTGHVSRIWDVQVFTPQQDTDVVRILSRGEDATCQLWKFDLPHEASQQTLSAPLALLGKDHYHLGKSLWSWTQWQSEPELLVFTGGADGRTIVRRVAKEVNRNYDSVVISSVFRELDLPTATFKDYLVIQPSCFLALSANSDVLRSVLSCDGSWDWSVIRRASGSGGWRLASDSTGSVAIAAASHSFLVWLSGAEKPHEVPFELPDAVTSLRIIGVATSQIFVLAVSQKSLPPTIIRLSTDTSEARQLFSVSQLPKGFAVSSAAFEVRTGLLVLGSRSGSLAVYDFWNSTQSAHLVPCVQESVHGSDAVTATQILHNEESTASATCVLTTGRDGTYAIHRLHFDHDSHALSFGTIHRSSPPFGPNIEGAVLCPSGKDIILYGFKSTSFVAYSITRSSTILSVDCGGAHRSWAYQHSFENDEDTLIWTKAGAINIYASVQPAHEIVKQGGHGREIKALAVSPRPLVSNRESLDNVTLIATGAEDTTIRLFAQPLQTSSIAPDLNTLHCLATLSDHTTGPQHLSFSPCGTYLFSSGGCEQFHVYRLTSDVPVLQLGVVLQDVLPTTKDDEDVRIMGFEIYQVTFVTRTAQPSTPSWEIVMAYSNGKAKHILYSPSPQPGNGHFTLLNKTKLGSFCLMHALILSPFSPTTCSTRRSILTAGTNGHLNVSPITNHTSLSSAMHTKKIHQSSVLSLATTLLTSTTHLVITGGDDNALAITVLMMPETSNAVRFDTVLVPKAHAAAVTALTIVTSTRKNSGGEDGGQAKVLVVSCACDQRVKLWEITVGVAVVGDAASLGGAGEKESGSVGTSGVRMLEHIQVRKRWEGWTCVDDVSNIGVVRRGGDEASEGQTRGWVELAVVGVGMEVLRLGIPEESDRRGSKSTTSNDVR